MNKLKQLENDLNQDEKLHSHFGDIFVNRSKGSNHIVKVISEVKGLIVNIDESKKEGHFKCKDLNHLIINNLGNYFYTKGI